MGAPITKKPETARGANILAAVLARYSSIHEAARVAGVHEATLRRWIFANPRGVSFATAESLSRIGVTRDMLTQ